MDVYINEIQNKKNPRFDQESMELTCFDLLKVEKYLLFWFNS